MISFVGFSGSAFKCMGETRRRCRIHIESSFFGIQLLSSACELGLV